MAASKNAEREARESRERLRRYNARQAVHTHQLKRRKRDNWVAVGGVLVVAALATVTQLFYFNGGPGTPTPEPSASASAAAEGTNVGAVPDVAVSEFRAWTGELSLNDVALGYTLDGTLAPQAVAAFVQNVRDGYYVDKTCHRLTNSPTFSLIQCGSYDGLGGTDASFSFGPIENAPTDAIYPAGTIAMARATDDGYSNGRQFFITYTDTSIPADNAGGYTVIGQVTSGLDAFTAQIADGGIADGATDGAPLVPTTITALTIE